MRIRFCAVLAGLAAASALVTLRGSRSRVGLGSVRQMWSDFLRDADQPGLRLTRISDGEEMRLGEELIAGMSWPEDDAATERVNRVAAPMLPYLHRTGIHYHFHVARTPIVNAFALPGGQVTITSGMLDFVHSDSELAEVLGHEMAHVDLRHAVEHYQYQYRLGFVVELFHRLATLPYTANQELDADAWGLHLASAAGYNPAAAAEFFERLQREQHEPLEPLVTTPAGELAHSLGDAVGSYFRTHPPTAERVRRLRTLAGSLGR